MHNRGIETHNIKVQLSSNGTRLDLFLKNHITGYSRSFLQKLINEGHIRVDGAKIKSNYLLKEGQLIQISIPPMKKKSIEAENIDLDIVYEDDDIIVINKAQGMVVHPAPGHYTGTLVNALLYHCNSLSRIGGAMRPGIVHRIDKDTSGLIVVAKNDKAHLDLSNQIRQRKVLRTYWAIVENNIIEDEGVIDAPIKRHPTQRKKMKVLWGEGSRDAVTYFKVLERFGRFTLVEARLDTGRTHQIRVHMAYTNNPIIGDLIYGSKKQKFSLHGQSLHSTKLGFVHPTNGEYMEFIAQPPHYFIELLDKLRKMS